MQAGLDYHDMTYSLSHGKELDVGQIGLAQEDLPPFDKGPVHVATWFAPEMSDHPLELEIGSGKGTFLVQHARQARDVNFIGIEWSRAYWRYAADRCRRHGLQNVRLVRAEAAAFLRYYIPEACLRKVHIYFPDPWPKKRHHKRRLVQEPLLHDLHRALVAATTPGSGLIKLATDHESYFQWILEHVQRVHDLFEQLPFDRPESAEDTELVGTNFERKYRQQGRPVYAMILRKRG